jgi:ferredoxin, 2Fe-2S
MVRVTFVQPDGTTESVDAAEGQSLMQAAVANGIVGIEAECGGSMSCATCHCYVDPAWFEKTGERGEMEAEMLEFAEHEMRENSRLSCQIELTADLDGIRVYIP